MDALTSDAVRRGTPEEPGDPLAYHHPLLGLLKGQALHDDRRPGYILVRTFAGRNCGQEWWPLAGVQSLGPAGPPPTARK